MSSAAFEAIAEAAAQQDVTLEFLAGKIGVKPVPDGDHGQIVMWLIRQCILQRPDLSLFPEQGLRVEAYRTGNARPDGALAPAEYFAGKGEWADPSGVLMVVEVTSYDRDTDRRDREDKPRAYAESAIPVMLLVDRSNGTVVVHSNPERGRYRDTHTADYGESIELPGLGITLDTEILKAYAR
ncbi:Uma2 family endonuclease [Kitasatospora sp. NPDC002227]|uniref:Uma2 family endonuclease n=1 Tax=Kitasatospora sp. NPDC002227 TaxID=3154773 RepID=UPI003332CB6B